MPIRPFAQRKQNVGSPLTHEYRRNGFRSARRFHLLSPGTISAIRSCCFFHASPRRGPALPVTKHHAQGTYMSSSSVLRHSLALLAAPLTKMGWDTGNSLFSSWDDAYNPIDSDLFSPGGFGTSGLHLRMIHSILYSHALSARTQNRNSREDRERCLPAR